MNKYKEFLDEYYQRVKKEIIEEYDLKLEAAKEKSELKTVISKINDFVEKQLELAIDLSPFIEDGRDKLFVKVSELRIENKNEEIVKLNYTQKDKDLFMNIADEKQGKLDKLNEVISDIKLLVATVENEHDFKELLKTYGIIDEKTGKLK